MGTPGERWREARWAHIVPYSALCRFIPRPMRFVRRPRAPQPNVIAWE